MKYEFRKGFIIENVPLEGVNTEKIIKEYYPHIYEEILQNKLYYNLIGSMYLNFIQPICVDSEKEPVGFLLGIFHRESLVLIIHTVYLLSEFRGKGLFVDCLEDLKSNYHLPLTQILLGVSNLGVIKALENRGYCESLDNSIIKLNDFLLCDYELKHGKKHKDNVYVEFIYATPFYDVKDCRALFLTKNNKLGGSPTCDIDIHRNNVNICDVMFVNKRHNIIEKILLKDLKLTGAYFESI